MNDKVRRWGENIDSPIGVTKIFNFPNYDKVCWGEVGYESTGPQSSKNVMKKYLGKYLSHTIGTIGTQFSQGLEKIPIINKNNIILGLATLKDIERLI
jgi:hypothetical protein